MSVHILIMFVRLHTKYQLLLKHIIITFAKPTCIFNLIISICLLTGSVHHVLLAANQQNELHQLKFYST